MRFPRSASAPSLSRTGRSTHPMPPDPDPPPAPTVSDRVVPAIALTLLLLLHYLPMLYSGVAQGRYPFAPCYFSRLSELGCLFIHSQSQAVDYEYYVRLSGNATWTLVPMSQLSQMAPFGYHTRIDFAITHTSHGPHYRKMLEEVSAFVRHRAQQIWPEHEISAVRIDAVRIPVGSRLAELPGDWPHVRSAAGEFDERVTLLEN